MGTKRPGTVFHYINCLLTELPILLTGLDNSRLHGVKTMNTFLAINVALTPCPCVINASSNRQAAYIYRL